MVQTHSPRPFISLKSNTYSHLQTGSDLIVGPFGPTTAFFDGRSKPKLSSNSFSNFFAEQFASHRIDRISQSA
jgi:hypothetical protein